MSVLSKVINNLFGNHSQNTHKANKNAAQGKSGANAPPTAPKTFANHLQNQSKIHAANNHMPSIAKK